MEVGGNNQGKGSKIVAERHFKIDVKDSGERGLFNQAQEFFGTQDTNVTERLKLK